MNDYISKPVTSDELSKMIKRWISNKEPNRTTKMEPIPSDKNNLFDREGSLSRLGGDEELLKEILALFLEDAPRQIETLKEALERGDSAMVRHQAHTLKGSSGSVGAIAIEKVAMEMQEAGKTGNLNMAASLLKRVEKEFEDLKGLLNHSGFPSFPETLPS